MIIICNKILLEVVYLYRKVKFNINNPQKIWFRNLQAAREAKGWTQVKLAMEAEVSQQSITFYESGTRVPSLEAAVRLAKVLDTTIEYLVGNDEHLAKQYYKSSLKNEDMFSITVDGNDE